MPTDACQHVPFAPPPRTNQQGYHNKPDETAKAFGLLDGRRFFRTGDLGTLTKEGFLTITGRLKELYKLVRWASVWTDVVCR